MSDTMGSLAQTDEYDPFAAEKFVNPAVGPMIGSILSLPRRAIENSQYSLDTGNYDQDRRSRRRRCRWERAQLLAFR